MDKPLQIAELLAKRKELTLQLVDLLWGSVEVRDGANKSVYLHRREAGVPRTIYAGKYSDDLIQRIAGDNVTARQLKRQLRSVNSQLSKLGYSDVELSDRVKTNIDFAKRNLVLTIYDQAVLEGVATTYADTETLLRGGKVSGMTGEDIQKINNLKHAWQLVLDEGVLSSPSDYNLLCLINKLVEEGFYYNAGALRSVPVLIGGTSWRPPMPIESAVREQLTNILNTLDVYDRAVAALLFIMRSQLFIDGNKRTAVTFANHILISNGAGLIAIPEDKVADYKALLVKYYETGDDSEIKPFLVDECLVRL